MDQYLDLLANWTASSPIVIRFDVGTGPRRAIGFGGDPARAAVLM